LLVDNLVGGDKERDDLYSQIDNAVNCKFEPSSSLTSLPWIKGRHYALTDIADARNAGVRTFSVLLPSIQVSPNNDNEYEYERVERMEEVLKWEFERMNRAEMDTIHSQIIESAVNYHAVAMQTQYLPYHYKGRKDEPRIKAVLRNRCFNWILHHPATVHALRSQDGLLEGVAKVCNYSAQELVDMFGEDNPGVKKLKEKNIQSTRADLLDTTYTLVDWTDWEDRVIWAVSAETEAVAEIVESDIVFMNEKHGLPFLPWVIVDKRNPLWQSVIQSGMWDNAQHMNIIRFAKAIELASIPAMVIQTPDGKLQNVWIDPSNPMNPMTVPAGTQVQITNRPPLDPGLETHFQEMRSSIQRSTVSQVLTDIGQYSNAPFSTVNQIVQMALGQLGPAKLVAEEAEARGFFQMFEWIEHSKIPLVAYRLKDKESPTGLKQRGEQLGIFPGDAEENEDGRRLYFDLDALYIKVDMKSQNAADEQARQNIVINALTHMGASKEWGWEQLGYNNFALIQDQRAAEMLAEAELQKETQLMMLEVQQAQMDMQQEAQAQQMEQQQQAQQAQQPQNETAALNAENAMSTMQGADMRGGMNPAAGAAPGMNFEQVTGTDREGMEI
jgi:hypothetical protein